MRQVPGWAEYYLGIAQAVAARSKDPSTQVGAVLIGAHKRPLSFGYNGFPDGMKETAERWTPECKHDYVIHAEENAILNAARVGVSTDQATLIVTLHPCAACARKVVATGIRMVVTPQDVLETRLRDRPELVPDFQLARAILSEGRVECRLI